MAVYQLGDRVPQIDPSAYVFDTATVIGTVILGARVSIWPYATLRGDIEPIEIGADSNVQDGTIIHVDAGVPCSIGDRVAIGHRAIVHGAIVDDDCLIAMGAILLNGVRVGRGSIIGAGALCTEGMQVPPGSLVIGVPGRVVRATTAAERERITRTVENYLTLQLRHARGEFPAGGR